MRIEDSFEVPLPVAQAWPLLMDIERIAPCLPGAQLQEIEGDTYRGTVKVKVGPITAQYKGSARFEHRDDEACTARVVASGRETRGQGNASATIDLAATAAGAGTRVAVTADLSLTGRVAQLGRGALAEVSSKLLAQFVENLERDLGTPALAGEGGASEGDGPEAGAGPVSPEPAGAVPAADGGAGDGDGPGAPGPARPAGTAARRVSTPEPEPVDLVSVGAGPLARRLVPALATLVGLWLLSRWIRRRCRRAR